MESRHQSDTIRLWESYRDQAMLWRALALLQIPATFIALVFALIMWSNTTPIINVPLKPMPGQYPLNELPEPVLIEYSTDFLNLIATYQSSVARRQFLKAREFLDGRYLRQFDADIMDAELKTIEATGRTQVFFVDPTKTKVERFGNDVLVHFTGDRQKYVGGKDMPLQITEYTFKLGTIPKNADNPYGLVVREIGIQNLQ